MLGEKSVSSIQRERQNEDRGIADKRYRDIRNIHGLLHLHVIPSTGTTLRSGRNLPVPGSPVTKSLYLFDSSQILVSNWSLHRSTIKATPTW